MSSITVPGAIDLHVHFREPGDNKAETIRTGSKAALLGGYVLVCDMPNNPGNPMWTLERLEQKKKIIEKTSYIPIGIYAGSQPESDNLEELNLMAEHAIGLKLYGAA
jgi:dihydroorotase